MQVDQVDRAARTSELAEALWRRYRSLVDQEMARGAAPREACCKNEIRGAMYLFAVDLVARLVDQVEQEPDPFRRARIIDALLDQGRSSAA